MGKHRIFLQSKLSPTPIGFWVGFAHLGEKLWVIYPIKCEKMYKCP